ncbi:MAG: hypothetical protein IJN67_13330 [Oscillospiraceae bacterium]|nr:hypothetical protein [Oscillospiraceae bacterium]
MLQMFSVLWQQLRCWFQQHRSFWSSFLCGISDLLIILFASLIMSMLWSYWLFF